MFDFGKIFEQVGQIKVRSVTDSLFRYAFLFAIIAVFCGINGPSWLTIFLVIVLGLFIVIGLIFYCIFAFKNPDYLRSETYQLKKRSIEIFGDKDNQNNPNISNIPSITNPYNTTNGKDIHQLPQ